MQRKISILIATDFACWIPFLVTCILHSAERLDATSAYGFFSLVVLPLNSVLNPLLYDNSVLKLVRKVNKFTDAAKRLVTRQTKVSESQKGWVSFI